MAGKEGEKMSPRAEKVAPPCHSETTEQKRVYSGGVLEITDVVVRALKQHSPDEYGRSVFEGFIFERDEKGLTACVHPIASFLDGLKALGGEGFTVKASVEGRLATSDGATYTPRSSRIVVDWGGEAGKIVYEAFYCDARFSRANKFYIPSKGALIPDFVANLVSGNPDYLEKEVLAGLIRASTNS